MTQLKMMLLVFACLTSATAFAGASRPDGFVLTQWGRWTQEEAVQALDQAQSVGARHISLLITLCVDTKDSPELRWCESNPGEPLAGSYQALRFLSLLPELQARHLSFSFIPFLITFDGKSRSFFWPKNRKLWFRNYGEKMSELGTFAQSTGAEELVVGSELTYLFFETRRWREVIRQIRQVYGGHLTLSPVFAQYPFVGFWDALDSIGVSAYFPLEILRSGTSVKALRKMWKLHRAHLRLMAKRFHKPLTFVEVGYPTTAVAARVPWDYSYNAKGRDYDEELPARCWEAFREVWGHDPLLRGFRIWGLSAQPENPKAFSPIGKRAEAVVRQLFSDRSS